MKISIKHYRFPYRDVRPPAQTETMTGRHGTAYHYANVKLAGWTPKTRGGYTSCQIFIGGGSVPVGFGVAACSRRDKFDFVEGKRQAVRAALQDAFALSDEAFGLLGVEEVS